MRDFHAGSCTSEVAENLCLGYRPHPRLGDRAAIETQMTLMGGIGMADWVTVLMAADAAAKWHVHQRRKGAAQEPYVNHLLEVASLVAQSTHGDDLGLVIAALLHDAVEDQEVPIELIETRWGKDVADLVREVTDDKTLPKEGRKRLQIRDAPHKSTRAKLLKLADKTSNLRAVAVSSPSDWSVSRRLEYVAWAQAVAKGLRGTDAWLEGQFDVAASMARSAIALDDPMTSPEDFDERLGADVENASREGAGL
jgi:hypothetical protein